MICPAKKTPRSPLQPSDLLDALLAAYDRDRTLKRNSFEQVRLSVAQFCRWFWLESGRPATIDDLGKDSLHDFMHYLEHDRKLASATVNGNRQRLVGLWNFAADCELVAPPRRVKRLRGGGEHPNGWTEEQWGRLYGAALRVPGTWDGMPASLCWELALALVYDTGCRFGELWQASAAEIDADAGLWRVPAAHRKSGEGHTYPLVKSLAVVRRAAEYERTKLWPFPYTRRTSFKHFGRLLESAGLPSGRRWKWHCIRRTVESMAAAKIGIAAAAERVGHSEAVARRHYAVAEIIRTPPIGEALPDLPTVQLALFTG